MLSWSSELLKSCPRSPDQSGKLGISVQAAGSLVLLQRRAEGQALLGGCMGAPCTDGFRSFQSGQGPRSHPSALSSHRVMAHPSSTKQCCASPWSQCHHAQPSRAAGCAQQGKEGWSRAFLPPLLFLLQSPQHCSVPSHPRSYPSVGIPSQVEGEKLGKKQPLSSLGHPCPCCPQEPALPLWWNGHPEQSSTASHGTGSCQDSRGTSSTPHPHLMSSFSMPCLGYIYPKEAYTLLGELVLCLYPSPQLPLPWPPCLGSGKCQQPLLGLLCAWDVLSSLLETVSSTAAASPCMNPVAAGEGQGKCVEEMEFLAPHNKADTRGLEHV